MYDLLCLRPMDSYIPKHEEPPPPSYLRLLNASQGFKIVDIHFNNHMVAKKFGFKKYTSYYPVPQGQHTVDVYKSGSKEKPSATLEINLKQDLIYTLALEGEYANRLLIVQDPNICCEKDMSNIRFIHMAPKTPAVDIAWDGNSILYSRLSYRSIPDYMAVTAGKHSFHIRQEQAKPILTIPDVDLKPGWNYTVYVAGVPSEKSHIFGMVLIDGGTYIKCK